MRVAPESRTCPCGRPFVVDVDRVPARFADVLRSASRLCPACVAQRRADQDAADEEREQRSLQIRADRHLRESGVPAAAGIMLEETAGEARDASRAWATASGPPILILSGPIGVGKSTLAAAAFRYRLRTRPGFWRTVPVLFAHLAAGFGSQRHDDAVALLDGRYMLALDDLDKARPTEYAAQHVFAAIDGCYANRTPLVVTTNLSMGGLASRWPEPYGEAIASRLTDRALARVVRLEGDDRRARSAGWVDRGGPSGGG